MQFDGQGLAEVTLDEWWAAHGNPALFPYAGGRYGVRRLVYAIGSDSFGGLSDLPPPSLQNRAVIGMYAERDGWTCHLCLRSINRTAVAGKAVASPDHLIPRNDGGSDHPGNIRTAHLSCNKARRDRPLTHVQLSESLTTSSVSPHVVTHDRKGREGKGREEPHACIASTGSNHAPPAARLTAPKCPSMHASNT